MRELAIREVADQTGLAAGTIRMWEQRYGFPEPQRTPTGYRLYSPADVDVLRRVVELRKGGLSVPAALERARATTAGPTDRPSIFGAVPNGGRVRRLRKRTLIALSRAIEDEAMASAAGPIVFGAFQQVRHYRASAHRYRRLAERADAAVVFADFDVPRVAPGEPAEVPIPADAALGNEWAVVIDAPGYAACLLAWERPEEQRLPDLDRRFESLWTTDPAVVRRAALVGCSLTRASCPELAERIERLLADRPLATEQPAPALTALTNRLVAYLEAA